MIQTYLFCETCKMLAHVSGHIDDIKRVLDTKTFYKCITTGCTGAVKRITYPESVQLIRVHGTTIVKTLTAHELLKALTGYGLPEEVSVAPDTVFSHLMGAKVISADIAPAGVLNRSIIKSLTLDNGSTIHIASGSEGPTIYKITRGSNGVATTLLSDTTKDSVQREAAVEEQPGHSDPGVSGSVNGSNDRGIAQSAS